MVATFIVSGKGQNWTIWSVASGYFLGIVILGLMNEGNEHCPFTLNPILAVDFFRWFSQSVWNSPLYTQKIVAGARRRVEKIMGMPTRLIEEDRNRLNRGIGIGFLYTLYTMEKLVFML